MRWKKGLFCKGSNNILSLNGLPKTTANYFLPMMNSFKLLALYVPDTHLSPALQTKSVFDLYHMTNEKFLWWDCTIYTIYLGWTCVMMLWLTGKGEMVRKIGEATCYRWIDFYLLLLRINFCKFFYACKPILLIFLSFYLFSERVRLDRSAFLTSLWQNRWHIFISD